MSDPVVDVDQLREWIGRKSEAQDLVSPQLVARFGATIGGSPSGAEVAAPGVQWCLAPDAVSMDALGEDGHPRKGGFLPPVPLPRRMWAAGRLDFHIPLKVGDLVTRQSVIRDVKVKTGKTGQLVFVEVAHAYTSRGVVNVTETQTIVYRGASAPSLVPSDAPFKPEFSVVVTPVEAQLFRYSALTFNAHRIHYDLPYATQVEGYLGLVVHGPLTATLLMQLAQSNMGGRRLEAFSFRGVGPAFCGEGLTLAGARNEGGMTMSARSADGRNVMLADARFEASEED